MYTLDVLNALFRNRLFDGESTREKGVAQQVNKQVNKPHELTHPSKSDETKISLFGAIDSDNPLTSFPVHTI